MATIIGSARHDEKGNITGGAAGDSLQKSAPDYSGEVSMQNFYIHSKGWYVLRPKDIALANKLAERMIAACNNPNIGYDQNQKTGVITYGINSKVKTETDCSTLIRACVKEASGKDPGNFTTANEVTALNNTKLFEAKFAFVSEAATPVYVGDILVTKTKGHTVMVVQGKTRTSAAPAPSTPATPGIYYPKYTGTSTSITTALKAVGESDTSLANRKKIASANQIANYTGTAAQNSQMVSLLKAGKLIKATAAVAQVGGYYPKYNGSSSSLVQALAQVGEKDTTFAHRTKIANANGIADYKGLLEQNAKLVVLLKEGRLIKA